MGMGEGNVQGACVFSLMLLQKAVRGNVVRGGGTLLLFIKLKIWFQVRPGFGNLHIAYMHNTHTYIHTYLWAFKYTYKNIVYSIYLIFVSSASASASIQIRVRPEIEPKFE